MSQNLSANELIKRQEEAKKADLENKKQIVKQLFEDFCRDNDCVIYPVMQPVRLENGDVAIKAVLEVAIVTMELKEQAKAEQKEDILNGEVVD